MTRTVWEVVRLNVLFASVSSTKVLDVVVTSVVEVTTYLLLKVNRAEGVYNHNATIRRELITAEFEP
jgi:hypothetical protein